MWQRKDSLEKIMELKSIFTGAALFRQDFRSAPMSEMKIVVFSLARYYMYRQEYVEQVTKISRYYEYAVDRTSNITSDRSGIRLSDSRIRSTISL